MPTFFGLSGTNSSMLRESVFAVLFPASKCLKTRFSKTLSLLSPFHWQTHGPNVVASIEKRRWKYDEILFLEWRYPQALRRIFYAKNESV